MTTFPQRVLHAIREKSLLRAGDRVGVAVSGGADSVALLRTLLELREELGVVVKVVHFNHRIRGAESDEDENFVRELATKFDLEFHSASGETSQLAKADKLSLETAARKLRYVFFRKLFAQDVVNKIATAHHLDDQAETLLLRLVRGSGMKGMRGVHAATAEGIVRPMLGARRTEIESYLRELKQTWRDDATNADVHHLRNRIRHELLPTLARDYNPSIAETLARTAEVLTADEEYLAVETEKLLPLVLMPGKPVRGGGRAVTDDSVALSFDKLNAQPLAMRRRLIRAAAERLELHLDMQQVESALSLPAGRKLQISSQWQVQRSPRELRFELVAARTEPYEYALRVPGEARVPEMNIMVRARLVPLDSGNSRGTLDGTLAPSAVLVVRSWRPGDRFRQAHASAEHKVKELLDQVDAPAAHRARWPVVVAENKVIWMRGARNPRWSLGPDQQIVIESEELD